MVPPEPQSAFFLVTEVASASREQTHGINQINLAVGQVDKVTQSNAASADESAAAEELSSQVSVNFVPPTSPLFKIHYFPHDLT